MNVDEVLKIFLALGVGGLLVQLVRSGFERKKMSADATKTMVEAATTLLTPLNERVQHLEAELKATKEELRMTGNRCDRTEGELRKTQEELARTEAKLERAHKALSQAAVEIGRLREALNVRPYRQPIPIDMKPDDL